MASLCPGCLTKNNNMEHKLPDAVVGRYFGLHFEEAGRNLTAQEERAMGLLHSQDLNAVINRKVEQIAAEAELHRPVLPLVAVSRKPPSLFSATDLAMDLTVPGLGIIHNSHRENSDAVWTHNQSGDITSPQIWPFPVNPNTLVQRSGRYRRTRAEVLHYSTAVGILEIEHMPRLYELVVPLRVRLQLLVRKEGQFYALFRVNENSYLGWAKACKDLKKLLAVAGVDSPRFSLNTMLPVDVDKENGARVFYWE